LAAQNVNGVTASWHTLVSSYSSHGISSTAFVDTSPIVLPPSGRLQPDVLPSAVTTSSSSVDLLAALSHTTVAQSTSDLLPDIGLLHLPASSSVVAAGTQHTLLTSATSQPAAPSAVDYSLLSSDLLTGNDSLSMLSRTLLLHLLVAVNTIHYEVIYKLVYSWLHETKWNVIED